MSDTSILGHHVPKGTQVLVQLMGPSFTTPAVQARISVPGQEEKSIPTRPSWDDRDISKFVPERWLRADTPDGELVFDAQAGPFLSFAAGSRGCPGKRLAYLTLRILTIMVVWSYRLDEVPVAAQTEEVTLVRLRALDDTVA